MNLSICRVWTSEVIEQERAPACCSMMEGSACTAFATAFCYWYVHWLFRTKAFTRKGFGHFDPFVFGFKLSYISFLFALSIVSSVETKHKHWSLIDNHIMFTIVLIDNCIMFTIVLMDISLMYFIQPQTFVLSLTRAPAIKSWHLKRRPGLSSQTKEPRGHLKHHSWMMMHSQLQLRQPERQEAQKIWHQGQWWTISLVSQTIKNTTTRGIEWNQDSTRIVCISKQTQDDQFAFGSEDGQVFL